MQEVATDRVWRSNAFLKLWSGQTVSLLGSQITTLALPLFAALSLQVSSLEMGLLSAIGTLPALLLALPGGVWVDRMERRSILVACDLARFLILALVPLAALLGWLSFPVLLVIVFSAGIFNLIFDIAYRSYLPDIIGPAQLVEANSKLEISRSAAEIAGPGLGGLLVQWLSAPVAILFDACSFLLSALLLGSIPAQSTQPQQQLKQASVLTEIKKGLVEINRRAVLKILLIALASINLFNYAIEAVWILYVVRDLQLEAGWLGLIFGAGNVGFLVGAVVAGRLSERLGVGRILGSALGLAALGDLFTVLADGNIFTIVVMLLVAQFLFGIGLTVFNINQVSLRQSNVPHELMGRVNSVFTFASRGFAPVGSVLGGVLGGLFDLRLTLLIAVVGEIITALWLFFSLYSKNVSFRADSEN